MAMTMTATQCVELAEKKLEDDLFVRDVCGAKSVTKAALLRLECCIVHYRLPGNCFLEPLL